MSRQTRQLRQIRRSVAQQNVMIAQGNAAQRAALEQHQAIEYARWVEEQARMGTRPGWYADPTALNACHNCGAPRDPAWRDAPCQYCQSEQRHRYFDGDHWTEGLTTSPPPPSAPATPPVPPPLRSPQRPQPKKTWWDRWPWIVGIGTALVLFIALVNAIAGPPTSSTLRTSTTATTLPLATTATPAVPSTSAPPATSAATTTAPPAPDYDAMFASLNAYMTNNFAATSWYPSIKRYRVQGDGIWVETSLGETPVDKSQGKNICGAVSGFLVGHPEYGLAAVRVGSATGVGLALRTSLGDAC